MQKKDLFSHFKAATKTAEKTDYEKSAKKILRSKGIDDTVSDQFIRDESGSVRAGDESGTEQSQGYAGANQQGVAPYQGDPTYQVGVRVNSECMPCCMLRYSWGLK